MDMANQQKRSIQQRWNDLQPTKTMLFWSCLGSVVVALIVGFTWGGWVTGGTARDMAATAGDESRGELASVICVEKFQEEAARQATDLCAKVLANLELEEPAEGVEAEAEPASAVQ
jgi:hypothetical protein